MAHLNIGGHLSLNGKPRVTVEWAAENGFQSMQIFASSPGAWKPPIVDEERDADFVRARAERGVDPLVIHSIYLINLASVNTTLLKRSRASLVATLRAAESLKAGAVVTHLGSHAGRGFAAVADQIAEALGVVLETVPGEVRLALENSAGAGSLIGAQLWELGDLIKRAGAHPRLNVALDTAHLCGAGWDFQLPGAAAELVSQIDTLIGLDRLALVHANDSQTAPGSRRDRHANIGEGAIGLEGFRQLLAQTALRRVPWILETPDLEQRVDDRAKLQALAVDSFPTGVPKSA
jgi:deoxyribonuclease IV